MASSSSMRRLAILTGLLGALALPSVVQAAIPNVPNGAGGFTNPCDPTKGFDFTPQTKANFGKINLKRGHRVVEFVLKYYF